MVFIEIGNFELNLVWNWEEVGGCLWNDGIMRLVVRIIVMC